MKTRRVGVVCPRGLVSLAATFFVLAVIAVSAGFAGEEASSFWCGTPVKIDGQMTEWTELPLSILKPSGVGVGFSNDSERLCVLFCFRDTKWAQAISMSGLTVWLDSSGKKKKDFGIRYRGGATVAQTQGPGSAGEGGFWESMSPEVRERLAQRQAAAAKEITVIQKKSKKDTVTETVSSGGSRGPAACFGSSNGVYVYEFSIPLAPGKEGDYFLGARPGQSISVGFEWGGTDTGDRQRIMEERGEGMMGGGPPGGGGMGPGGGGRPPGGEGGPGRPGGPGGPGGGPGMAPPEKQDTWLKVTLASGPTPE